MECKNTGQIHFDSIRFEMLLLDVRVNLLQYFFFIIVLPNRERNVIKYKGHCHMWVAAFKCCPPDVQIVA